MDSRSRLEFYLIALSLNYSSALQNKTKNKSYLSLSFLAPTNKFKLIVIVKFRRRRRRKILPYGNKKKQFNLTLENTRVLKYARKNLE